MMRNPMQMVTCGLCCSLMVAWPARAEDLKDATEIVKKVDAAAKAVSAVRYSVKTVPNAAAAARFPSMEATIIAKAPGSVGVSQFSKITMKSAQKGSEAKEMVIGGDGENFYLIDHKTKKAYVDPDPGVIGSVGRSLNFGMMAEYLHPTPFTDELNGDKRELLGSETIDGEDCYKIKVIYANAQGQAVWWFSKKDFLPRQREDTIAPGATLLKTVSKLEVGPELDDAAFKMEIPEGYTKVDDFAP